MDYIKRFSDCLLDAEFTSVELDRILTNGTKSDVSDLNWLQSQLNNVMKELAGMLADIDAGVSIDFMGLSGDGDLEELIEDFEIEISSLKGRIQSLLNSRFVINK